MADGKVVISTALDNSGIEKDAGQLKNIVSGAVKGSLGGLAKVAAGAVASIVAAFGAAAVAITKQAVDAYADYEQLIGGVETLFKGAADRVVENAEDAFYRVGISANEYMETVTSFSASLISALSGDTAKAADVADMALIDMADNANKMGTSLESIKTAYQGFAKQNYTMLDNLKLGYGGTKTEMERLLADAQKLTGIKYNINNLADVYNAIHEIQKQLGIAGATKEEAEKTIKGSAAMTAAAWKNVLTAISGGGDIDKAINNLVYSVSKYFDNIVPVVERSLAGIGELIEKVAPMLVQTVATALIKAIPSLLNAVYQMIVGLAKGIYDGIAALLSGSTKEISAQINATEGLADGFGSAADGAQDLADATEEVGKAAKKSLAPFDEITKLSGADTDSTESGSVASISGGIISVGTVKVEGVEDNVSPAISAVVGKIREFLEPLRNIDFSPAMESIKNLGGSFADLGETIIDALGWAWADILAPFAEWTIEEAAPAAVDMLSEALDALDAALEPVFTGLKELWKDLEPIVAFIEDTVIIVFDEWEQTFSDLADMFEEKGDKIEDIFSGIGDAVEALWVIVEPILTLLRSLWQSTFRAISDYVVDKIGFMIDGLGGLVDFIAGVLTLDWERAWNGIKEAVKAPINSMIGFINAMINAVVNGINTVIGWTKDMSFTIPDWELFGDAAGKTFGVGWQPIVAPQIPYLAQGAVLPPNKPFMAVVGDQTHGTNIEAPLSTIKEAVADVTSDIVPAMVAGFEAVIAEQQATRRAVESIEVGDTTIGQAANRYNTKIATIRGGA